MQDYTRPPKPKSTKILLNTEMMPDEDYNVVIQYTGEWTPFKGYIREGITYRSR